MKIAPSIQASDPALAVAGALGWWVVGLVLALGLSPRVDAADNAVAKEHQIKAAFVYNFAKFVAWPAGSFQDTNSPLVIGVAGKGPIGAALEAVARDRKVNGRSIIVKSVETVEAARGAHLLFVAVSEDKRLNDLLPALSPVSVLTIGESDAFGKEGGMINFILEGDKCRFDINLAAAEKAGVKISAQLLKLARNVRRNP